MISVLEIIRKLAPGRFLKNKIYNLEFYLWDRKAEKIYPEDWPDGPLELWSVNKKTGDRILVFFDSQNWPSNDEGNIS